MPVEPDRDAERCGGGSWNSPSPEPTACASIRSAGLAALRISEQGLGAIETDGEGGYRVI